MTIKALRAARLALSVSLGFLFAGTDAKAQLVHKFSIHFESNSSGLSEQAIKSIDSILVKLTNNPAAYKVELTGYTDSTGSLAFNRSLSVSRAKETSDYFKSKKFPGRKITYSGKAYAAALANNSTDRNKYLNRRVEIAISVSLPKAPGVGGLALKDDKYKIAAGEGTIINYPTGTRIVIEPNSFVDKNGKPVKGNIELVYSEYRTVSDFILAGIPMDYIQKRELFHFNSAGMFKILANQNGAPVYLDPAKAIKIDFPVEKDLDDLNFYRLDSAGEKWTEIAKLNGRGAGGPDGPGRPGRFGGGGGGDFERNHEMGSACINFVNGAVCTLDDCTGLRYLISKAPAMANSDVDFSGWFGQADSTPEFYNRYRDTLSFLDKKIKSETSKAISLERKESRSQHLYAVQKNTEPKNSFQVICKRGTENEINALRNPNWVFAAKKHRAINDSVFRVKWKSCRIIPKDNDLYNIELSNSSNSKYLISGLKMQPKEKMKRKKRLLVQKRLFEKYDSTIAAHESKMALLDKREDSLNLEKKKFQDLHNALTAEMSKFNDDSLCCFWEKSRPYMSKLESGLGSSESWLFYFTYHKAEMLKRYAGLKDSVDAICKRKLQNKAARQAVWAQNGTQRPASGLEGFMEIGGFESDFKKGEDLDKTRAVFKELSVSSLGVYNCDQLSRLQEPVIAVTARYTSGGKDLPVILIYLVDETMNGVIRYDGLSGLGPNLFQYSASSKSTLIAFDEAFRSYVFKPERFKALPLAKGKTLQYTFEMEPIGKLQNKKALEKLVK